MSDWTRRDELIISAYTVLVAAGRKTLQDVPERYRAEVEVRVAERTLAALEGDQ